MAMDLDELAACIDMLKDRIQSHRASLQENESRTRMALIDPLLRALGWDVSDPVIVTPEYKVNGERADYALLRPDGQPEPAALLEAKRLDERLDSHRMQMVNYANMRGINYAGLTDGNNWELYRVFEAGRPLQDRQILDVSIAGEPAHASALKLLLLWRPNLAFWEPAPANAPILAAPQPDIAPAPAPRPPAASNWVALSEYNPPKGTPCPTDIRFWDQSERPLQHWRDILTHVVEKLYREGQLTVEHVPIIRNDGRAMVHTEPVHPTGEAFQSHRKIEGNPPLFVHVHMNAASARHRTRWLLKRFSLNPAAVYLRLPQ